MILATMIEHDEDALICDLAETYHIFNYKQLPPSLVAVFAIGLKNDSRIKMSLAGQKIGLDQQLMAGILDRLSWLVWSQTKDGHENRNRPKSIVELLTGRNQDEKEQNVGFSSGKEFERYRKQLIGGG